MPDVNVLAVLVATIAAFVSGATYYAMFGRQLAEVSDAAAAGEQPPPWKLAVELVRCLIIAAVVAGLASRGAIEEWTGGLLLGLALWIGFPLVLWMGAMIHENTPWKLAVIHAGDWLAKLLVVGVIVSVWQ
ncbi:MAG: DUF1761 domain-containing protein [Solirubrobacteraceae bacterium]